MTWQRIETAPRDGTWILVTGGKPDPWEWYGSDDYPSMVAARWADDDWYFCDWDGALRSKYINASHWMPLPDPPK